jgi:GntR family transcriptional regulator/MocR family aminotransferase
MPRPWSFPIAVDPADATPIFLQIVRAVSEDVLRARLRPGQALPGSRTLASEIGVHRSTVVQAYGELVAQGWAVTRPRGGTTIAATSPKVEPRRFSSRLPPRAGLPAVAGFALAPSPADRFRELPFPATPPGTLVLGASRPDMRLLSSTLLGRALRRAARAPGQALLGYARDRRGHRGLRQAIARMVSLARGLAATGDDVLITQGTQGALDLVARALISPGDGVAVEVPGYRSAWATLRRAGAQLHPVPVDGEGIRVSELAPLASRLRAVYVTPHHQYPTTTVLSPRRRVALLELARAHGLAIIEDDYDHEFHYQGRPVLPLASADRTGQVVYVGTLSKILAPGLRLGFVVAPAPVIVRLAEERAMTDGHGVPVVEAAVAELLEDGEVQRHARRVRRIYQRRRDVLCGLLSRHLGSALSFQVPAGGTALWAQAERGIDVERWRERASAAGVVVESGASFAFCGEPAPFLRLGFAPCDERELALAVRRLARALPA